MEDIDIKIKENYGPVKITKGRFKGLSGLYDDDSEDPRKALVVLKNPATNDIECHEILFACLEICEECARELGYKPTIKRGDFSAGRTSHITDGLLGGEVAVPPLH